MNTQERFWSKVVCELATRCWLWTTCVGSEYGGFTVRRGYSRPAHRVAYEWLVGPIPTGMVIDHLCRTRKCVRPDHLEAVPQRVNVMRGVGELPALNAAKITCPQGHPYDYVKPNGQRCCRRCKRDALALRRRRQGVPLRANYLASVRSLPEVDA